MKPLRSALTIGGAVASIALAAGPALAAGGYTVTAGSTSSGTVSYTAATTGGTPQVQFDTALVSLTCDSGTAAGSINLGSSASGTGIATIASSTFTNCLGPLGIPLDVTQTAPWRLNATGAPTGGVTAGGIDQVSAHVSNPDGQCDFDVTGSVQGNVKESDQSLNVVSAGSTLTLSNVNGCFGLLNEGDNATFVASYAISNPAGPLHITQP